MRTVITYFIMATFVGGFVFAGASSSSTGSTDGIQEEWARERESGNEREQAKREFESDRESESRSESASESYSENAQAESYNEGAAESSRESRERSRESREYARENPPVEASEGVRTPGSGTPETYETAEEIPSEAQPTTCAEQAEGELCSTLSFHWSKPHRHVMWYVAPDFENYKGRQIFVRPVELGGKKGKKGVARLSSIVVFYQSGDSEDLIKTAVKLPAYKNRKSKGALYMKAEDDMNFWLRSDDAIEAIYIKADSWINKDTPVNLEFRVEER